MAQLQHTKIKQFNAGNEFESVNGHGNDTEMVFIDIEDEFYHKALKSVPANNRDDGSFGLDVKNSMISSYSYTIDIYTLRTCIFLRTRQNFIASFDACKGKLFLDINKKL